MPDGLVLGQPCLQTERHSLPRSQNCRRSCSRRKPTCRRRKIRIRLCGKPATKSSKPSSVPRRGRRHIRESGGDIIEYDIEKDRGRAGIVLYYDDTADGGKRLAYADILSAYETPDGHAFVEHGYFYDREDLEHIRGSKAALPAFESRAPGRILSNELVNTPHVFHTHASCIEGKVFLTRGGPNDLPGKDPESKFFWRRAIDLPGSFEEIDPSEMKKPTSSL